MGVVDPLPAVLRVAPFAGSVAAGFDSLAAPVTPTAGDRPSWGNVEPSRQPLSGRRERYGSPNRFCLRKPAPLNVIFPTFPDRKGANSSRFFPTAFQNSTRTIANKHNGL